MAENTQMIEQIFSNIDAIGSMMEGTVDLSNDVVPFMSSTLAKIKQLAMAKESNYEAQYELFQIATNYLPRTVNAYCALPIEYRNTKVIKLEKTARQFLIEDLKILKTQVVEIEKQFYAGIESQIKVNSSVVREKYEHKFQLATELEQVGEDGFVNQFDYSKYQNSSDYKNITFKKQIDEEEILAKQKAEKRAETLDKVMTGVVEKSNKFGSFAYKQSAFLFQNLKKALGWAKANLFVKKVIGPIFTAAFVGTVMSGVVYLIISVETPGRMRTAIADTSKGIYDVMAINLIPSSEFGTFVKSKEKEMIDGVSYRADRIKVSFDEKNGNIVVNVSDLNKDRCSSLIDAKENKFDAATVKVNGMALPQDYIVSNFNVVTNENHKLCHLNEDNKMTLEFNNQKIYNFEKESKILTSAEKEAQIAKAQKELADLERIAPVYAYSAYKGDTRPSDIKNMISRVGNELEWLKKQKTN